MKELDIDEVLEKAMINHIDEEKDESGLLEVLQATKTPQDSLTDHL